MRFRDGQEEHWTSNPGAPARKAEWLTVNARIAERVAVEMPLFRFSAVAQGLRS